MMLLTLVLAALTALSPWTSQPATVPDVPTQLEAPVNRTADDPPAEPVLPDDPVPTSEPEPAPEPDPETESELDPANPVEAPVPTSARPRGGS